MLRIDEDGDQAELGYRYLTDSNEGVSRRKIKYGRDAVSELIDGWSPARPRWKPTTPHIPRFIPGLDSADEGNMDLTVDQARVLDISSTSSVVINSSTIVFLISKTSISIDVAI